jgi:hypothetical protein
MHHVRLLVRVQREAHHVPAAVVQEHDQVHPLVVPRRRTRGRDKIAEEINAMTPSRWIG